MNENKHVITFVFDNATEPGELPETVEFTTYDFDPKLACISLRDYCNQYGLAGVATVCDMVLFDNKPIDYV